MTDVFMFLFCISLLLWLIYVIKFNDMLLKKIDLQQRIDKAIEYINKDSWHYTYEDDCDIYLCESELEDLLEILQGDVSNE